MIGAFVARYALAASLTLAAAGWAAAGAQSYRIKAKEADADKALLAATQEAKRIENEVFLYMTKVRDEKDAELIHIAGERDRLASELRNRPERLPETSASACAGSTGRELSEPDAQFLAGLAAEQTPSGQNSTLVKRENKP